MLKELLDGLVELAQKSDAIQIVHEAKDGTTLYRSTTGAIGHFDRPPDPRNHKALDSSAVTDFASVNDGSVIWYSREAVVCLINDETRRDRVTLTLEYSPQMKFFRQLEANGTAHTQAQLVLILRTTLAGCAEDEAAKTLLPAIRAVKFTKTSEGEAAIDHGRASIGKRLTEQATGAVAIPETVVFKIPVFANAFQFECPVICAVDVDAGKETFRLIPLPLEIERAIVEAEGKIFDELHASEGTGRPIYYGAP